MIILRMRVSLHVVDFTYLSVVTRVFIFSVLYPAFNEGSGKQTVIWRRLWLNGILNSITISCTGRCMDGMG